MKPTRSAIAVLVLSAAGLVSIVGWESYRGEAYIPVKGDVPTIGFGTTGGVKLGDTIRPERALFRALTDVNEYEAALRRCVTAPLFQYEYDAYVSLAYNIGPGAFCGSTLVRTLNQAEYAGACQQILRWDRAGGRQLPGLIKRRQSEYAQCMGQA